MDLSKYISKDNETFYFDPEEGTDNAPPLLIAFENTDIIKWVWEEKKLKGKLKAIANGLFEITNVTELKPQ
jgi:hypothetical protein